MKLLKNPFLKLFFFLIIILVTANQKVFAQTHYKGELTSISDFNELNTKPITNKYGNVKALKVVYDIKANKLYFINSKHYKYHSSFCVNYLGHDNNLYVFNKHNYSAKDNKRRYLLGNVNYYKSNNLYTLELSPVDEMSVKHIHLFYKKIEEYSYFKYFKFFLNTYRLESKNQMFSIPIISASNLYKGQSYQAISTNKSYGKLRFVDIDSIKQLEISKHDIIIIDKPILELPITAGLITTNLQTPLSHISILGKNRKVPMAAYTKAMSSSEIKKYENQYVSFEVKLDTFYIKPISKKTFDKKTKTRKNSLLSLKKEITADSLIDINYLNNKSIHIVGGKAANFGVLKKLSKKHDFKVPESAFAIPFYYYDSHIKKCGADTLISNLISRYSYNKSINVDMLLKNIQNRIKKTNLTLR